MNTFTMLLLAGFGVVSGVGLGLAASPLAKLARYMHDADHVSQPKNLNGKTRPFILSRARENRLMKTLILRCLW